MAEDTNIQPMQSDFEQIKKVTEEGKEYWSAREQPCAEQSAEGGSGQRHGYGRAF